MPQRKRAGCDIRHILKPHGDCTMLRPSFDNGVGQELHALFGLL
jgi:hypothetical protein